DHLRLPRHRPPARHRAAAGHPHGQGHEQAAAPAGPQAAGEGRLPGLWLPEADLIMKLVGRTVLVTGASSGIGEAVARAAYARGAIVLLVARNGTKLKALAAELGIRAHAYPCDVGDPEAIADLAEAIHNDRRNVDVLVNNAGG